MSARDGARSIPAYVLSRGREVNDLDALEQLWRYDRRDGSKYRVVEEADFAALIDELRAARVVVELARQEVVFDEPLYHALADYDRLRKS